jgi:hypothetical protein
MALSRPLRQRLHLSDEQAVVRTKQVRQFGLRGLTAGELRSQP